MIQYSLYNWNMYQLDQAGVKVILNSSSWTLQCSDSVTEFSAGMASGCDFYVGRGLPIYAKNRLIKRGRTWAFFFFFLVESLEFLVFIFV